ncbi:MAG: NifB/NifX family molybdenum-iron cluster-binding protein [Archaeoglobaceae archaeon]
MKIAASTNDGGMDDTVTEMFGRTGSFTIVEVNGSETSSVEVVQHSGARGGGAGIVAAQTLADKGVEILLTGRVGPNAMEALSSSKIKIYRASGMKVEEAVKKLMQNELQEVKTAQGRGQGMGKGKGRF